MRNHFLRASAGLGVDSDEHIANTELLLKGEGSNGQTNNTFVDSSASNHSITRNGDTTQGSFSPFSPKGWSMYVDGTDTTQGIVGPTVSSTLGTGTGDWTIEFWYRFEGLNTSGGTATWLPLIGNIDWYNGANGSFWLLVGSNQKIDVSIQHSPGTFGTAAKLNSTTTLSVGSWYHIAVVKQSNTGRLYINGTQENTVSLSNLSSSGFHATSNTLTVGRHYNNYGSPPSTTTYGKGYFSNVRVTSSAVYPDGTTFTPSTEPLTAITDCTLLTLQDNRYVDNSSLNSTITAYDSAAIKPTSPFSGNREYQKASYFSGKFDGSDDRLELPDSPDFEFGGGDFTIECWVYLTDWPFYNNTGTQYASYESAIMVKDDASREFIFKLSGTQSSYTALSFTGFSSNTTFQFASASYSFNLNTWYHITCVRNGSSVRLYVNGVDVGGTNSWTTTIQAGSATVGIGAYTQFYINQNYGSFLPGYISNFRVVKGTALYTTAFTPPTAPLTPVANTKLLTLQDNYLVDHSPSSHSITNNGVALEPESPFSNSTYPLSGTFYSGYFDGSNDYIDLTANLQQTGQFTIEFWFYADSITQDDTIYNWGNNTTYMNPCRFASTTSLGFYKFGVGLIAETGTNTIQPGQWYHVAVTKNSSNTLSIWLDGVLKDTYAFGSDPYGNSNGVHIGANDVPNQYFHGYISNFRCVSSCLYTSDFTVPSEPLTAVSGTTLLTLQDATVQDNSSSSHSITNNGVTITEIAPFGAALIDRAGSMYFDGNGDYLEIPYSSEFTFGTGDFTIECWIYREQPLSSANTCLAGIWSGTYGSVQAWLWYINTSNELRFVNNHATVEPGDDEIFSSPATLELNKWNHIAVTRNGNVWRTFVDGTQAAVNSNYSAGMRAGSNPLVIGYLSQPTGYETPFKGYISDFRITKGTALYTSNFTPPTAPLQPITNTKLLLSGNNGGVEDSLGKRTFETDGNAQIDTTVKKFGSGAIEFDGNGDYLKGTGFDLSGKYTIEGWVYRRAQSGHQRICIQCGPNWDWSSNGVHIALYFEAITNYLAFELAYGQNSSPYAYRIKTSTAPAANTWHYIAVTCDGTNTSMFLNGARVGTTPNAIPANWLNGLQTEFSIGNNGGISATNANDHFNGFIDDFRITTGVARYDPTQTTHAVPTKTHPTI